MRVPVARALPPMSLLEEGGPSPGLQHCMAHALPCSACSRHHCIRALPVRARHLARGSTAGFEHMPLAGRGVGDSVEPVHGKTALRGAGMVKRVRGIAYSMRVAPAASNRMVDGARSVLNPLLADVFVFTDHMPGHEAGESPGYGLSLVAETTTGLLISSQASAPPAAKVSIPSCPLDNVKSRTLQGTIPNILSSPQLDHVTSVSGRWYRDTHMCAGREESIGTGGHWQAGCLHAAGGGAERRHL